jgi:hypothetical protein
MFALLFFHCSNSWFRVHELLWYFSAQVAFHEAQHLAVHFLLILLLTAASIKARSVFFQQELAICEIGFRAGRWLDSGLTKPGGR